MPRKNHNQPRRFQKPKSLKRPRRFHRGPAQDRYWQKARRRLDEAV